MRCLSLFFFAWVTILLWVSGIVMHVRNDLHITYTNHVTTEQKEKHCVKLHLVYVFSSFIFIIFHHPCVVLFHLYQFSSYTCHRPHLGSSSPPSFTLLGSFDIGTSEIHSSVPECILQRWRVGRLGRKSRIAVRIE